MAGWIDGWMDGKVQLKLADPKLQPPHRSAAIPQIDHQQTHLQTDGRLILHEGRLRLYQRHYRIRVCADGKMGSVTLPKPVSPLLRTILRDLGPC